MAVVLVTGAGGSGGHGWMNEDLRSLLQPHHPLGRLGTPTDIAGIVSFLLSSEGRWISGQLLQTDGGFSARY